MAKAKKVSEELTSETVSSQSPETKVLYTRKIEAPLSTTASQCISEVIFTKLSDEEKGNYEVDEDPTENKWDGAEK